MLPFLQDGNRPDGSSTMDGVGGSARWFVVRGWLRTSRSISRPPARLWGSQSQGSRSCGTASASTKPAPHEDACQARGREARLQLDEGLVVCLDAGKVQVQGAKEELLLVLFYVKFQREGKVFRHQPPRLDLHALLPPANSE